MVWLAEQKEPVRRKVAVKVIKLGMDTKQVVARFEAERQALALMDHPNIAKVFDAGSTDAPLGSAGCQPAVSPTASRRASASAGTLDLPGVPQAGSRRCSRQECLRYEELASVVKASLRVVDRLMDVGAQASWGLTAGAILAGHVLVWLLVQVLIRDPFAPPPRGVFFEHRTFQWWKDNTVSYLFLLFFFVGPYTRIRLAERVANAGRWVWAADILAGRRWSWATFPATSVPLLIVIAAVAIMGLGFLDYQSLVDPTRAGAARGNGPWRTVHIIGYCHLYVGACMAVLWWNAKTSAQLGRHRTTRPPASDGLEGRRNDGVAGVKILQRTQMGRGRGNFTLDPG